MPFTTPPRPVLLPLPTIVKIFLIWLYFLTASNTLSLIQIVTIASGNVASIFYLSIIPGGMLFFTLITIMAFHKRAASAVRYGVILCGCVASLLCLTSFGLTSSGVKKILSSQFTPDMWSQLWPLLWPGAIGTIIIAGLHGIFLVYLKNSQAVKAVFNLPPKKIIPFWVGSTAALCSLILLIICRLLIGLFFSNDPNDQNSLPIFLLLAIPHAIGAISVLVVLYKKSRIDSPLLRLGAWFAFALLLAAVRPWVFSQVYEILSIHMLWAAELFLYTIPNFILVAIPLMWWNALSSPDTHSWSQRSSQPFYGIPVILTLVPPPLTVALIFIAYQTCLLALGGVAPSFVPIYAGTVATLGQFNPVSVYLLIFPFGVFCIHRAVNNPRKGIPLCGFFCVVSIVLHLLTAASIIRVNVPVLMADRPLLVEVALLVLLLIICTAAFYIINTIITLPNLASDSSLAHALVEPNQDKTLANEDSPVASTVSVFEKVVPTLPKSLQKLLPKQGQPLPVYIFSMACIVLAIQWTVPMCIEAMSFSSSPIAAIGNYGKNSFLTAVTGFFFPAGMLFIMNKKQELRFFSFFLGLWLVATLFLNIYPTAPTMSLNILSPEMIIILAMLLYSEQSDIFKRWYPTKNNKTS